MNKKYIGSFIFLFVLAVILNCFSVAAFADPAKKDTVAFDAFAHNAAEKIIRSIWMKDPEYKDYTSFFNTAPQHMTGVKDLNDDGNAEIFARHSDPDYVFCDKSKYTCRLHIYSVQADHVVEIGRMMAGPDVVVTREKTNGYHDLMIQNEQGHLDHYVWNGKVYAKQ